MIPLLILSSAATVLTLLALWIPVRATKWLTAGTIIAAIGAILVGWNQPAEYFNGLFRWDLLAQGLTLVALLGVLWAVVIGRYGGERLEYYLLALYAATGMLLMASTPNLVVILIALEALSLPLYVLATWRRDEQSYEAGLKYFLLGALSAAVFLYGIALHFGATGSFNVGVAGSGTLYVAAMVMLLIGLAFKASMVPFHWWTPDVYQGSPTGVSLLMATAVKAAAFAALVRLTSEGLPAWGVALAAVIVLTLIFGNLGALAQTEAKRLLAYSSIAHAGYVGVGLFSASGGPAISFYLLTYLLGTGLAFAVLSALSNGNVPYERLRGLFQRNRLLGVGFAFAMLSLAGLPPFPGFWGKLLVFLEGAKAHQYTLLVLALVTSAIAAYYYLRLFSLAVLSRQPEHEREEDQAGVLPPWVTATPASGTARWAMIGAMGLIGILGILPFLGYRAFAAGQPTLSARVPVSTNVSITSPSNGAEVPAGEFSLQGTGQPGETLEVYDGATRLGMVTVGQNGGWSFALEPAPSAGTHTYQVRQAGQAGGPSVTVNVTAPSTAAPSSGELGFTAPAANSKVPAGSFALQGTGKPGDELEVFEDGVSLGKVTVAADERWSLEVPAPTSGAHTYEVRAAGAAEGPKLSIEVERPTGQATCDKPFALANLSSGGTVSTPFRFGGTGQGRGTIYVVTVKRGERVVGRKEVPMDAACGWSYQSNPGTGAITYEVRAKGTAETAAPLATINLNVQ